MSKNKDIEKSVLDYMMKTNRPFGAQDIATNLQTEFGKTAIIKALEQLSSDGKIIEKIYGKSKIYFIDQDKFGKIDINETVNYDEEIERLTKVSKELQDEIKTKEAILVTITGGLSIEKINEQIKEFEGKLKELEKKSLNNDKNKNLDDSNEMKEMHRKLLQESRKRKRIAQTIVDTILEGCSKPKKQFLEDMGIEQFD